MAGGAASNGLPDASPARALGERAEVPPFAELGALSNYTFLTGASHPEELVQHASALGYRAIGIADVHSLAGIVRAHVAAKQVGMGLAVGARVVLADCGVTLAIYAECMDGYRRLCRLLTTGKRRAPKGECWLTLADVEAMGADGVLVLAFTPAPGEGEEAARRFWEVVARLRDRFGHERLCVAACCHASGDDAGTLDMLAASCAAHRVEMLATNAPLYHTPDRRPLQDVLACIKLGCTLGEAGLALMPNAERCMKPADEMHRLFAGHPAALAKGVEWGVRAASFSLDELRYEYPDEVVPKGREPITPIQHLRELTYQGAAERYPRGVPASVVAQIEHELALIGELNYAPYFLTVHDLVRYARSGEERPGVPPPEGWAPILCQGRGAAANSAVCYCLGVTAVDPSRVSVLFERFVSRERNEPPDIDIDFEHERREEVIQYIYRKYGRDRAALCAEVCTYRRRSAIRDIGKALGLSLDCVDRLAKTLEWWDKGAIDEARVRALGLDPQGATLRTLAALVEQVLGFPRHLSQHVGGFVIARSALCELVPVENAAMPDRTVIEWDKDDIDAVGMMKVDCLGLGMLTCIRRCIDLINAEPGRDASTPPLAYHTVPPEDPAVYEMICDADTVGVFQIESRAQMSMLPRLKPRCYYDLVIEVAIVRPGPIQGDMVHPYLRRRNGEEPVEYAHPSVKKVLERTLGVPLFQEQCMALAVEAAGFTPGQADQLRRAMAAWKRKGDAIFRFGQQIISGMVARGIAREFAERCFEQIKGFSEYGFPESHAASFALLVYVSCWLKRHHPAAFAAALINSQPMGFYQPAQIVADAQEHGVRVLAVDVNMSRWDCTLEPEKLATDSAAAVPRPVLPGRGFGVGGPALRLGLCMVRGLGVGDGHAVERAVREHGPFSSVAGLRRAGVPTEAIRALARADAFRSMGLDRRHAAWQALALRDESLPLFDGLEACEQASRDASQGTRPATPALPPVTPAAHVREDYITTGLSLKAHPMSFHREVLEKAGASRASDLRDVARLPHRASVVVAGIVLMRQRPETASGIVFMTLEDETGAMNLIVRPDVYERHRDIARRGSLVVRGRVERAGKVTHVLVRSMRTLEEVVEAQDATPRVRVRNFH
jgi:error-prone DNA polymerase